MKTEQKVEEQGRVAKTQRHAHSRPKQVAESQHTKKNECGKGEKKNDRDPNKNKNMRNKCANNREKQATTRRNTQPRAEKCAKAKIIIKKTRVEKGLNNFR